MVDRQHVTHDNDSMDDRQTSEIRFTALHCLPHPTPPAPA